MTDEGKDRQQFHTGSHYTTFSWSYLCPLLPDEPLRAGFKRVLHALITDLIEPFGQPTGYQLWSASGQPIIGDISTDEPDWRSFLLALIPEDPALEAVLVVEPNLVTADGEAYTGSYPVSTMIEGLADLQAIEITVGLRGTVFGPAEHNTDERSARQLALNGPRLTAFLQSIHDVFDATLSGQEHAEQGPVGFSPGD